MFTVRQMSKNENKGLSSVTFYKDIRHFNKNKL